MNSRELNFLIRLISSPTKISKNEFYNINYENFVKYSSAHLMLPAIYSILKKQGFLKLIPKELNEYLYEIYKINKERNIILRDEISEIAAFLNKNNINYSFIKGASLIEKNIYDNVGDRMVGDIDILIDKNQSKDVIKILKKNGYEADLFYKYWKPNVYPVFKNKSKLFSIDLHIELLPKKYNNLINSNKCLKNIKFLKKDVYVLDEVCEIRFLIYNFQLCDYGYLRSTYSLRIIYDLIRLNSNELESINNDKIVNSFFEVLRNKGVDLCYSRKDNFISKRLDLRNRFRILKIIDVFLCNILIFFKDFRYKLIEFVLNKNYRNRVLKKIYSKTNLKTIL